MDFLRMMRCKNLFFVLLIQVLIYYAVIVPILQKYGLNPLLPNWFLWLVIGSTLFICAGGYVINDYFDLKIDRINKPDKVVIGNSVSKKAAMTFYLILSGIGIAGGLLAAILLKNTTLGFIFIVVTGMLWFYSSSYKRQFLIGNLIVAICAGLVPIVVLAAEAGLLTSAFDIGLLQQTPIMKNIYLWVCGFAGFAFMLTLVREIIKDIEDIKGDREMECRTLPIVWGEKRAKIIAICLFSITLLVYFYLFMFKADFLDNKLLPKLLRILIILLAGLVYVFLYEKTKNYKMAGGIIKIIMFCGLLYTLVFNYAVSQEFGVPFLGVFKVI